MSSACIICHKRKVRCDLAINNPCTKCTLSNVECRPYTRKRKRFTNSLSPKRSVSATETDSLEGRVASRLLYGENAVSNEKMPSGNNVEPTIKEESYRGRSEYVGGSVPFDETMVKPGNETTYTSPEVSATDLRMLSEQGAYELPPIEVQRELMQSFHTYCAPWTPVVDPKWLDESAPSMLLLQSIFLAGSRVSKAHLNYGSSETFYRRAKLLFFFGGGHGSLISIVAACLLHWYNPVGPEDVSTDTSGFWIRQAGAMAFQIGLHKEPPPNARNRGLRRRLWWSLVIRDNIISVGVGRPRTINLRDSDVLPPSMADFSSKDNFQAQLFMAYCAISNQLGDTVECYLRHEISRQRRVDLENAVYRWAKQVIPKLRTSAASQEDAITSNMEVQQLLVMYFVTLTILHRSPTPNSVPPAGSLVASSFLAGIYEEFLLRDELRYLGPVFAFYPLCAGLSLLSSYRYRQLRNTAEHEITIMKLCLKKLSERWLSAVGPLRALDKLTDKVREQGPFDGLPPTLDLDTASFFQEFDIGLCKQWQLIEKEKSGPEPIPRCTLGDVQNPDIALPVLNPQAEDTVGTYGVQEVHNSSDLFGTSWEGSEFDWSGSWLLNV